MVKGSVQDEIVKSPVFESILGTIISTAAGLFILNRN